jgi:hypothetical protein
LYSTKWREGKKKKGWKPLSSKNNSIQNSMGNKENGYPVLDLNKTTINVTKELSNAHKKTINEEIFEKFMEKILDMVNQNVQDPLKKFHDTKNKEHEATQKQIKELRVDLNKNQSETKDTIKKKIHELNRTTQTVKKKELITFWKTSEERIKQKS